MQEKEKKEIFKILDSIPDQLEVIENQIGADTIEEYHQLLHKLEQKVSPQEIASKSEISSANKTKELLVSLSRTGDVKAYREIEEIIKNVDDEVRGFAFVALKFARMNLESQLLDEPTAYVSSALGGKGNKLRYYFVVTSADEIDQTKESDIIKELKIVCEKTDSEFEEIENHTNYALVKVLISIDFAIGPIIEELIQKCSFLDAAYLCTNVEKPTKDYIHQWLRNELN